jgi:hypothetical protein
MFLEGMGKTLRFIKASFLPTSRRGLKKTPSNNFPGLFETAAVRRKTARRSWELRPAVQLAVSCSAKQKTDTSLVVSTSILEKITSINKHTRSGSF